MSDTQTQIAQASQDAAAAHAAQNGPPSMQSQTEEQADASLDQAQSAAEQWGGSNAQGGTPQAAPKKPLFDMSKAEALPKPEPKKPLFDMSKAEALGAEPKASDDTSWRTDPNHQLNPPSLVSTLPSATSIGPRKDPDGATHAWLQDLQSDVRDGGASTWVGSLLKKVGFKGTAYGGGEGASNFMPGVSALSGIPHALEGAVEMGNQLEEGLKNSDMDFNKTVGGANKVLSGLFKAVGPAALLSPAGGAMAGSGLGFGAMAMAVQPQVEKVATYMGASPEVAEMVGNVAVLGAGGLIHSGMHPVAERFGTAVNTSTAAEQEYQTRSRELETARGQAAETQRRAIETAQKEQAGQATPQETDAARELASEQAKNVRVTQEAFDAASERRADATIAVDKLHRQLLKSATKAEAAKYEATAQEAKKAKDFFQKAAPSKGYTQYSDEDYDVARAHLEEAKKNGVNISDLPTAHEALENARQGIEDKLTPYWDKYKDEPLSPDAEDSPKIRVAKKLAQMAKVDGNFDNAMDALSGFNITDPSVGEAKDMLTKLNNYQRAAMKGANNWDINNLIETNPEFAARFFLADELRDALYSRMEGHGVKGAREARLETKSLVNVRDAVGAQITANRGGTVVRGSAEAGVMRNLVAKLLRRGGKLAGAGVGAKFAGVEGAIGGAALGEQAAGPIADAVAQRGITRDQHIEKSMKYKGTDRTPVQITGEGGDPDALPSENLGIGKIPPAPKTEAAEPVKLTPREHTDLHAELAAHYGEANLTDSTYQELEDQLRQDVAAKNKAGKPLEPAEKTLLKMILKADASDKMAEADAAEENAKVNPEDELPEPEPEGQKKGLEGKGGGINVQGAATSSKTLPLDDQIRGLENEINVLKTKASNGKGSPQEVEAVNNMVKQYQERLADLRDQKANGVVEPFEIAKPKEVSTGDEERDQMIRDAGGVPAGIMKADPEIGLKEYTMFHEPNSGSTLALKTEDLTPERIKEQVENKQAEYAAAAEAKGTDVLPAEGERPEHDVQKVINQTPEEVRAERLHNLAADFDEAFKSGQDLENYTRPMPLPAAFMDRMAAQSFSEAATHHHEFGHSVIGSLEEGSPKQRGIISHRNPRLKRTGAVAAATFDLAPVTKEQLPFFLRRTMAGAAANEVIDGIPRDRNPGLVGDMRHAHDMLRTLGFPAEEHDALINAAIDQAKEPLTKPGVADIIKDAAKTREDNLPVEFHHSENKVQGVVDKIKGILNDESRKNAADQLFGNPAGASGAGASAGEVPNAGTEGANPGANAQGTAGQKLRAFSPPKSTFEMEITDGAGNKRIEKVQALNRKDAFRKVQASDAATRDSYLGTYRAIKVLSETKPQVGEPFETAPDRVSTRVTAGKNATENHMEGEPLIINRAALDPRLTEKFAGKMADIPGVKVPSNIKDPVKITDRAVRHFADNLKHVYGLVPPDAQEANGKWYESANNMTKDIAEKYGAQHPQVAGATAALSPQMDWDMNVAQMKRLVDTVKTKQDFAVTPEMMKTGEDIINRSRAPQKAGAKPANQKLEEILKGEMLGKKFSELSPAYQSAFVRLYDETYGNSNFPRIDPGTGEERELRTNTDGSPAKLAWGNLGNIEKALSIMKDGSRENISENIGDSHKVRNFYNNIIDPSNPDDVTIDTHAVGAATLLPLGGDGEQVLDNFGKAGKSVATGVKGTYPIYADAYRLAAKELGVLPRALQSVTWEKVRELFPAEWKTADNLNAVKKIWKAHEKGDITGTQARTQITDMAANAQAEVAQRRAAALQTQAQKQLDIAERMKHTKLSGKAALGGE